MPELTLHNGACLYYLDPSPGGNPAVILLHGLGVHSDSWQLQIPSLSKAGFRPVAPDLPGFGQSSFEGRHWSIAWVADICLELISALSIPNAVVVGISMGGTIALQLALSHPDRLAGLVLVNTFASLRPDTFGGWIYLLRRYSLMGFRGLPEQAEYVAMRLFPKVEQAELRKLMVEEVRQSNHGVYKRAMRALGLFDSRRRLGEINLPTLVISGDRDSTVPLKNQRILAERIPGAHQVMIADAGHAVTVDQPDDFNQVLLEFLAQFSNR